MENHRSYEIECLHLVGTLESKQLKVTALNLFHPTASPPFLKGVFLILRHSLMGEKGGGGGHVRVF
jgi:hypothetical protein